jgi:hypothetical protein
MNAQPAVLRSLPASSFVETAVRRYYSQLKKPQVAQMRHPCPCRSHQANSANNVVHPLFPGKDFADHAVMQLLGKLCAQPG